MQQRFIVFILLVTGLSANGMSQAPSSTLSSEVSESDESALSIERIFGKNEFRGSAPAPMVWSTRSESYFTLEKSLSIVNGHDLIQVELATGARKTVVPASDFVPSASKEPLNIDSFAFSHDESLLLIYTNSRKVWRQNTRGDYWVLNLSTRKLQPLGGDAEASSLMFAKFSPDGTRVAYVHHNDLYVQDIDDLGITPITTSGSRTLIHGTSDWVNEEELGIRDGYRWSPDSQSIAFWQFDTSDVREAHLLDNTSETYPKITSFAYPKVGEQNSATRLGVITIADGKTIWLDVPGDARQHYIPQMEWTPNGSRILLQQLNRLQNTLHVMLADAKSGMTQTILTETDSTWVDNENPVRWLNNGSDFLWLSQRDGWRHLYAAGIDGKRFMRITEGDFDVIDVESIDQSNNWVYYFASPNNATQRYLYRTRLEGGEPERLSPIDQPGWHATNVCPKASWAIDTYSSLSSPPVTSLVQLPKHESVRILNDNAALKDRIAALKQPVIEFFQVDIGDGVVLDGWAIKPPKIDPNKKYPMLFYVYGEPASQSVTDMWAGKRGLWHWMLAQQGYVVVSIDNRGTAAPRGREWRKAIYRQIGILASKEQSAAAQVLLTRWPYVDRNRVGIWGWSGGGSMSLNALFRYPDLYSTAMAVAPNASQLLYDTIYQERYMGLPDDNASGYRDGSPITHAENLRGNLLLVHGTGDDNCHYQGTERLINKLIERNKHFTVLPYPGRSHSIDEGMNTELHLYSLLSKYLKENLAGNVE